MALENDAETPSSSTSFQCTPYGSEGFCSVGYFSVDEVYLVASHLLPDGAAYEVLEQFALTG